MPESIEVFASCHACGAEMDVTSVPPFGKAPCPNCGEINRVKREFGPYILTHRHAIGGMSVVFIGLDQTLNREVALKILSEEYSVNDRRIEAFEEEARITASFSHPHVVRVFTTGRAFGRFYIAMELVPGGHFEHQIRERGKIPEIELLPLAIQVAQGLKAAHAAGLIHRDMKPGNILLDSEGSAKIVDFGLALLTKDGMAKASEIWATPYYVPPETVEGHAEDFRSDVYAFGATLYHALAGKPSCGEETMSTDKLREAKRKVVPLKTAAPFLSADVCRIVDRAMAYEPKDRFSSYDEMIVLLEAAFKRLKFGIASDHSTAAERRAERNRGEKMAFAAAGVVLLAALSAGIWWVARPDPVVEKPEPAATVAEAAPPEAGTEVSPDIGRRYAEARNFMEAGDYAQAALAFAALRDDPAAHEPTRTWAGVEAAAAFYLEGNPVEARQQAELTAGHLKSLADADPAILGRVLPVLKKLEEFSLIPPPESVPADAAGTMAAMLAGLDHWEKGLPEKAVPFFTAVSSAVLPEKDGWVRLYQTLAAGYLADWQELSKPVFEKLPADQAACEKSIEELEVMLGSLRTRGRARFNVRAWQLELTRHAKALEAAEAVKEPEAAAPDDLATILKKLSDYAAECRFAEAIQVIKQLPAGTADATRNSLLSVIGNSAVFLTDLEADLARGERSGEVQLKAGGEPVKLSAGFSGGLIAMDSQGKTRECGWRDFTPDSIISLHRVFVKSPASETERLRRHECAISFDWLAGNRERALAAAARLSQESPQFKSRWDTIAAGLPE